MAKGYIKLHRAIKDCWIWNDNEPFTKGQAWIDLLLSANHADKKILFEGKLRTIHAGQFHTSILKLSDRWKWDRRKTTQFLKLLESDEMITTNSTTHGTTINIVNWGKYQIECTTDGTTESTTDDTTDAQPHVQPMHTNKNDKECKKNDKKNNKATAKQFVDDAVLNGWVQDFISHRRKIKKPMTDKAIELFIQRLERLCPNNKEGQIAMIQTAIERGWQTVYPNDEQTLTKKQEKNDSKLKALENYYMQEE